MYNRAELRPAFDAIWAATRDRLLAAGVDAPKALTVVEDDLLSFWQRTDLLLSQTCGYPYCHFLKDRVTLVGTPDFGLTDCPPGHYRSAWVVRADDPRQALADFQGATFACNDMHSQSGCAAPMLAAQQAHVRFAAMRHSGAHMASARMVANGEADIAGLDAISWRHMTRFDPWTAGLRVLGWTEPTPGLPFVTAFEPLADILRDGLCHALAVLPPPMRDLLTMEGIVRLDQATYVSVLDPAEQPWTQLLGSRREAPRPHIGMPDRAP
jgi:ABC-type phosphate/phosphonate transport system substrate-binding protein